jgi:hypothetical protein
MKFPPEIRRVNGESYIVLLLSEEDCVRIANESSTSDAIGEILLTGAEFLRSLKLPDANET